jgi:hypothetical protein
VCILSIEGRGRCIFRWQLLRRLVAANLLADWFPRACLQHPRHLKCRSAFRRMWTSITVCIPLVPRSCRPDGALGARLEEHLHCCGDEQSGLGPARLRSWPTWALTAEPCSRGRGPPKAFSGLVLIRLSGFRWRSVVQVERTRNEIPNVQAGLGPLYLAKWMPLSNTQLKEFGRENG